jgi:hypothetical protein
VQQPLPRASPGLRARSNSGASSGGGRCFDDFLDLEEAVRQRHSAERDEGGVDIRRRPEDGAGDGVEAGPLRRKLDEDRDRPVRLRRRLGEEAICHLSLHHDRPVLDRRQAGEALRDDRRCDVVGQVRDELRRCGPQPGQIEREGVAPVHVDVVASEEVGEVRLQRAVELHRVDMAGHAGEPARENSQTRPDLEHHVFGTELGKTLDHGEDVLVGEEVLAQLLLRTDGHGRQKAAAPFASIRAASSS